MPASISSYFKSRQPSAIRMAQIEFAKRTDGVQAINTAIGNVSLPMHPAMRKRMMNLAVNNFKDGVVKYTPTVGTEEANQAFLNIIKASGFKTTDLYSQITDGGSQAMELMILGVCGPAGAIEKPLLVIDPAYTNYKALAGRLGRSVVSISREFQEDGRFTLPDLVEIEKIIQQHQPGALLVIPYDNPTGQFYSQEELSQLAKLCVKYNMWLVSDEAYRGLHYTSQPISSIWGITDVEILGIEGRRISIETSSKIWNACGLRIGALVTDNQEFHQQAVAEYTANLSANTLGQYIFGALADLNSKQIENWYKQQRDYYQPMMAELVKGLKNKMPELIVSQPAAAIYSVVDARKMASPDFDAMDFVLYCARQGKVVLNSQPMTLLVAPMAGFYSVGADESNPGKTQMRLAYVEPPKKMKLVPELLDKLLKEYFESI